MEQFEYRVVEIEYEDDLNVAEKYLNALGKEGWELVHIINHPRFTSVYYHYYFKRKIISNNKNESNT